VLTLPPVTPHILSGALRGIGVASEKRNTAIPNVPTYAEMGYPNMYVGSWVGLFAPAKTPDAVVAKLNAEINAVMKEPDSLERLKKAGFEPVVKSAAEVNEYFKTDVESWGKMVQAIGFSN
jgi:tripartite-type tricarboxylate transporter receptor subunit TctC